MRRSVATSLQASQKVLKIYGFPLSQPTRSVLMLCKEGNIPTELVNVDATKGDTFKKEFRDMHPAGLVPLIDDNGFLLGESAAIMQYLCEKHQLEQWYPTDPQARARVNFWLHWHHGNTRNSTKKLLMTVIRPSKDVAVQEGRVAEGGKLMTKAVTYLELALSNKPNKQFLAGTTKPTIADLLVIPELDQQTERAFQLFDFAPYPHVQRYVEDVKDTVQSYEDIFTPVIAIAKVLRNGVKNNN